MNVEIVKNDVCVGLEIEFDADGEADVKFSTPNGDLVDRVSQINKGWSFQDPESQKDLESIIDYMDSIDWDLWLQDVEDGDIYEVEEMKRKGYDLFKQANIVFADENEVEIQIPDNEINESDIEKINEISETCVRNFYKFEFKVDFNQHLIFIIIDADYFDLD